MNNKLYILWTSSDPITAEKMVCMYARNSKLNNWWKEVTVIIWGAAAKVAAEHIVIRERIKELLMAGVEVSACKACADQLGVTPMIEELGVQIEYWGEPLTKLLKEDAKVLTI